MVPYCFSNCSSSPLHHFPRIIHGEKRYPLGCSFLNFIKSTKVLKKKRKEKTLQITEKRKIFKWMWVYGEVNKIVALRRSEMKIYTEVNGLFHFFIHISVTYFLNISDGYPGKLRKFIYVFLPIFGSESNHFVV